MEFYQLAARCVRDRLVLRLLHVFHVCCMVCLGVCPHLSHAHKLCHVHCFKLPSDFTLFMDTSMYYTIHTLVNFGELL